MFFCDALPDYWELIAGEVVVGTPTIRLRPYSRGQREAAAVSLDPLGIEPVSNSISRASYESHIGDSPFGWIHSGCWSRRSLWICRSSAV